MGDLIVRMMLHYSESIVGEVFVKWLLLSVGKNAVCVQVQGLTLLGFSGEKVLTFLPSAEPLGAFIAVPPCSACTFSSSPD